MNTSSTFTPPPTHNLHVECCLKPTSTARIDTIRFHIDEFLRSRGSTVQAYSVINVSTLTGESPFLNEHVETLRISESSFGMGVVELQGVKLVVHVYQCVDSDEERNQLEQNEEPDSANASSCTSLPSRQMEGLWESLIFDDDILARLLNYVSFSLLFGERRVDPNIISFNKVVLLHGPPGTGKTSLCRALAQKLSIRFTDRFSYFTMVEINAHSLFSKFFSESGKLVLKMFQSIKELTSDPETFVVVLIDEVESLTAALQELIRCGLILTKVILIDWRGIHLFASSRDDNAVVDPGQMQPSDYLYYLAGKCVGFSGRTIRKLPFLVFTMFIKRNSGVSITEFLEALRLTINEEHKNRRDLTNPDFASLKI
ncbi:Pachytene checkpoint protein 2 [Blyttiomyces sp. JEL0837]|nr:Pachytene checkpoint protein 2 [Blyttiomyces sp. JEL0837]